MIDVDEHITTVRRTVGSRVLEAGEGKTVTISRTYDADVEEVWDACTSPERLARWLVPVSGELRLDGRYQLEGNAGGTVTACAPPHSFAATWEYGEDVSWIEVRVTAEDGGRARLELEHIAHIDDHWEKFGPAATGVGWDIAILGLALHVDSGEPADPQEVEAWLGSDDGKRFMVACSERWGDAHIATGADESAARAMAERTAGFFTGEGDASTD